MRLLALAVSLMCSSCAGYTIGLQFGYRDVRGGVTFQPPLPTGGGKSPVGLMPNLDK